jgi:hypothetical protein
MCKTEPFFMARSQKLEELCEPIVGVLWDRHFWDKQSEKLIGLRKH